MTARNGRLAGRVALVTGGSQGIGLGIARALAAAGADIMIAQRRQEEGERAVRTLRDDFGVAAEFIATDVTDRGQVERMVAHAEAQFGKLDILVNNAGGSAPKRLEDHSDEEMTHYFLLNYWSTFWAMRAAFPGMKGRGWGRIINLGSLNGVNAHSYTAAYNASKEAVRALSRTAAVEWAQFGVNVNIICPAAGSPASDAYFAANPEMLPGQLAQIPRRKLGDAEKDIGPVAVFLASDDCAHMTGGTFFVDGGSHINGVSWSPSVD